MKLHVYKKVLTKEYLKEEVWKVLKQENQTSLMNIIDEGIYKSKTIEDALNFVARYFTIC